MEMDILMKQITFMAFEIAAALYILYPGTYVLGGFMYLLTALVIKRDIARATQLDRGRLSTRRDSDEDLKHD